MTRFFRNVGRIAKKAATSLINPSYGVHQVNKQAKDFYKKSGLKGVVDSPGVQNFLSGSPEIRENVSTLRPEQEPLYNQAINAGLGSGAGGAFGDAADYYRNLLSNESADFDAYAAPELRRYNEQLMPDLAEQFAGMGAGNTASSGFQNALTQGATDLSERLGEMRSRLKQSAAQGLQGIGQAGLQNFSQNMVTQPGSEGFLSNIAPAAGTAIGSFAGPLGAAAGNLAGNWFKSAFGGNKVGANTSPYGGNRGNGGMQASPQFSNQQSRLPDWSYNAGR